MKVLVVCEDPTHDQFVVKPVVERALEELGLRNARVSILDDPHLRGFPDLMKELPDIVADARMEGLIIVVADNDGGRGNNRAKLENAAKADPRIVPCCAVEEVETWMLALHRDRLDAPWAKVRNHPDVKEAFALPFLTAQGQVHGPGGGRKAAMKAIGQGWRGLLDLCSEITDLMEAIRRALER